MGATHPGRTAFEARNGMLLFGVERACVCVRACVRVVFECLCVCVCVCVCVREREVGAAR